MKRSKHLLPGPHGERMWEKIYSILIFNVDSNIFLVWLQSRLNFILGAQCVCDPGQQAHQHSAPTCIKEFCVNWKLTTSFINEPLSLQVCLFFANHGLDLATLMLIWKSMNRWSPKISPDPTNWVPLRQKQGIRRDQKSGLAHETEYIQAKNTINF